MLRMFRELKGSYRYIVLIFALLFGQAFCDLALHRTLRILLMWVYSRVVFRTVCRIRSGKAPWISCFYSWTVISSKKSKNIIR